MSVVIDEALVRKCLAVIDAGLVKGVGKPVPGSMCVEAAICYALGEPHGDDPSCVGSAVRAFKIRLNDSAWPTDADRTEGMRKLAIAQLGSDTIDQNAFRLEVAFQTIKRIVPIALRGAAKLNPTYATALEIVAVGCEVAPDLAVARTAVRAARDKAREVRDAAVAAYDAYAAYDAVAAGDAAADTYAYAAYDAAAAGDAVADTYAYAAYAAAAAVAAAAGVADDVAAVVGKSKKQIIKSVLMVCADIGLQALIKLGSPGCAFLDLAE